MKTASESITPREKTVARAVYLVSGYFKHPDRDSLTIQAREFYDADRTRTARDIAYLVVRNFQARFYDGSHRKRGIVPHKTLKLATMPTRSV
jgi:hypothetical protein